MRISKKKLCFYFQTPLFSNTKAKHICVAIPFGFCFKKKNDVVFIFLISLSMPYHEEMMYFSCLLPSSSHEEMI